MKETDLGEVFSAPYDVVLDNENVVQPDILFVSKERQHLITEKNLQGAPDFIIEILSETTAYKDAILKKLLYARAGVKEYWLVSPDYRIVEVYYLKDKDYILLRTYSEKETIESQVIKGLKIDLKEIF